MSSSRLLQANDVVRRIIRDSNEFFFFISKKGHSDWTIELLQSSQCMTPIQHKQLHPAQRTINVSPGSQ